MSGDSGTIGLLHRLRPRTLEDWGHLFEILSKFGLAMAAVFALYEFRDAQDVRRTERAMAYVDRFEQGSVAEARRALNAALRPYHRQFVELAAQGGISVEDKGAIILTLMEGEDGDRLADSLDQMVDFYESVALCAAERLCAAPVVEAYFCPGRAGRLWEDFKPYVQLRRANNPDYGMALEACANARRTGQEP